jgi:pimeloyl-ACP methyl ester carboxylesterase
VVFTADGAGDYLSTSAALREAVAEARLPLHVEPFEWSHGPGRILIDQIDYAHARQEGRRLAGAVSTYRQSCPDGEVYLVSHSAGSAVVLAAAECLPPDSVDRIILLAPAVSTDYDLRPALRCARDGIDVFYSRRDALLLMVGIIGTVDRRWTAAAGRVGFRPQLGCPGDALLYAKLRQHPWAPCVAWTGHNGGHYGVYRDGYLRAYVVPLLCPARAMGNASGRPPLVRASG